MKFSFELAINLFSVIIYYQLKLNIMKDQCLKIKNSVLLFCLLVFMLINLSCLDKPNQDWSNEFTGLKWVAYNPPLSNPIEGIEATKESIKRDLSILRQAGFTGLVTYSCNGNLGENFIQIAQEEEFQGIILGIWDPLNEKELKIAVDASKYSIISGYCVGNEGLFVRYNLDELSEAINKLRELTNKPVTTTEEIDDYSNEDLLDIGDWIFPNAHPYFHNVLEPKRAVEWTLGAFNHLKNKTKKFVMFKEVGFPTSGNDEANLSEENQKAYYNGLKITDVDFVYFEGFDQPWKTHLPIEPHWGLFRSDGSPKRLAEQMFNSSGKVTAQKVVLKRTNNSPAKLREETVSPFYIYQDAESLVNHFKPTGYMGDTGDIYIDEAYEKEPYSGKTCIQIKYSAKGTGPNSCYYSPPCKWAGTYWQEPPNNWGKNALWKDKGFDLSKYKRLKFWAKSNRRTRIEFKVGGINEKYGDSLHFPRSVNAKLTDQWQEFEIDLSGAEEDLSYIIGGFVWVTNWTYNPNGVEFYIDEIRFEK